MKYFLLAFIAISTLSFSVEAVNQSNLPVAKPKIIGGEIAEQSQWPWMSALVFTYSDVVASLAISGTTYTSTPFSNSPSGQASGTLVDCGIANSQCSSATDKICLIARGEVDFSVKVDNCQAGGGVGAIIFNNVAGNINGTLGADFTGTIPVVAISQDDGAILLEELDSIATIDISAQAQLAQSSSCGASFLGEKWVLTAAHCVEDANLAFLKVNVGEYDLSNGAINAKSIKNIYIHPEYNEGASFNNDIALIELVEVVNSPSIALISADASEQLALANSSATVIGWGNRIAYAAGEQPPENSQPTKLHQVELSLLSNEQCKEKLAQGYSVLQNATITPQNVGITDSMICAESTSGIKGSCQGDSGGPLVVNTNQGWQQIGIVSYGVGCADVSFPDVYTRAGKFTEWITRITQGIAINSTYDFAITPQNTVQSTQLNVTNNSILTANLAFSLVAGSSNSNGFSLNTTSCNILAAKQSCQVTINFDAKTLGFQTARIIINSDDNNIPTSETYLSAQAIPARNDINTQLSKGDSDLLWFSGGNQPWRLDTTEAAIISGAIGDSQESSVLLTFSGAGSLSFDWTVSSEENTDTPEAPYDALYLIVDGKQVDFISGEVKHAAYTLNILGEGNHQVTWIYKKDGLSREGEDKGSLKNVIFTPTTEPVTPPTTEPVTPPTTGPVTPPTTGPVTPPTTGPVTPPTTGPVTPPTTGPVTPPTTEPVTPPTTGPDTKSSGGSVYFILFILAYLNLTRRRV